MIIHIDTDSSGDTWNSFCGEVTGLTNPPPGMMFVSTHFYTLGYPVEKHHYCPRCVASDKLTLAVLRETDL